MERQQLIKAREFEMNTNSLSSNLGQSSGHRSTESQDLEFDSNSAPFSKILNYIKTENDIQKQKRKTVQALHAKRVQSLRKELEYLKSTEWKYQPVDQ